MSKTLYEYDATTGELLAETAAVAHPFKPGEYLGRMNATFLKPPACRSDEVAVFEAGKWTVKADYRGRSFFLRDAEGQIVQREVKAIGEPIPEDAYDSAQAVPLTLAEQAVRVREERDRLLAEADVLINRAMDAGKKAKSLRAYRQALRDVPAQPGFPQEVTWPGMP